MAASTDVRAADDPDLTRALTVPTLSLFGLAYLAPMIVLGTYGVLAGKTHGSVPTAYLLALLAMTFTASSYGRMAKEFPVAGSAYTYTRRTIDSRVGFLVGWAVLLDYFFLPMVIWLIGASFLNGQFPGVPNWVWIIAFIVVTTILNIVGIKVAANLNILLMTFQILVVAIFVVLSIRHTASEGRSLLSGAPFLNNATTLSGVAAGAAVAAYSFLGFDAVTTLTEETKDPTRTLPRAIMIVVLVGGGIFLITTYATQLVHPGASFAEPDNAASQIAKTIGGDLFASIFLAGFIVTQFASGVAAQASVARLLFAMGRDRVLPKAVFGYVHPRFHTPVINILLSGVVGLVGIFLSVATSTSFINFGAFTAFTFVNISVIGFFLRHRGERSPATYLAVPVVGAMIDAYLLTRLDPTAIKLGLTWLAIGIVYLLVLTRMFRRPPPEMAPEGH